MRHRVYFYGILKLIISLKRNFEEAKMEPYLLKRIKEVITEHPEVGEILSARGIACVTCGVGTCLLKDIVEVHGLSFEQERDLLTRIAGIVFPGKKVEIPVVERKTAGREGVLKYS